MEELSDTEILDWIEEHVFGIRMSFEGGIDIWWYGAHQEAKRTRGADLRDAVRKAMAEIKEEMEWQQ